MNKSEKKNGAAFYIALCCCVAIIGLVGYIGRFAANSGKTPDEPTENVSVNLTPTSTPIMLTPTDEPVIITPKPASTAAPVKATPAAAAASTKVTEPQKTPAPPVFTPPCSGKVLKEMSDDELEYNKILGDWRTHDGVDIAVPKDEQIKAVHSGTVVEIFSGVLGETVIVDCKNGFTVVYGCLAETDGITVGQQINAGEVIASAGGTGSENTADPHLHLELIRDGECVNPCDYIKFGA